MTSALNAIKDIIVKKEPVGSRVTCNPAPTDTDEDWLILIEEHDMARVVSKLNGFVLDNPNSHYEPANSNFNSWRDGNINLIITRDEKFYDRFLHATKIAKLLNLMLKSERVQLFQYILYGNES